MGVIAVVVIDCADIGDKLKPIQIDVIKAADKRADEGCARFGSEKRLVG